MNGASLSFQFPSLRRARKHIRSHLLMSCHKTASHEAHLEPQGMHYMKLHDTPVLSLSLSLSLSLCSIYIILPQLGLISTTTEMRSIRTIVAVYAFLYASVYICKYANISTCKYANISTYLSESVNHTGLSLSLYIYI